MSEINNRMWVKRLRDGDMAAFDAIYKLYFNKLYGFVLKFMKQREETEEIVQEVFIKVWDNHENISPDTSFQSYLFTIAYNTTISTLRKKLTQQKYVDERLFLHENDMVQDNEKEEHQQELTAKLNQSIQNLPPRQKEVLLLSRYEGLTHKQIATKLNISENTVKNQIVAATKILKKDLQ